jgi:hypothetical protein
MGKARGDLRENLWFKENFRQEGEDPCYSLFSRLSLEERCLFIVSQKRRRGDISWLTVACFAVDEALAYAKIDLFLQKTGIEEIDVPQGRLRQQPLYQGAKTAELLGVFGERSKWKGNGRS